MKNLISSVFFALLPFCIMAQDATQIIKTSLKDVQMAMHLADFQRLHPKAEGDVTMPGDAGVLLTETVGKGGIKSIDYYFQTAAALPLYRIEVQFEDNDRKDKAAKALFGKPNHPKIADYWLIYKGENDYITVVFALNEVMTFLAATTDALLQDDLFINLEDVKNVDLRINKSAKRIPIIYNGNDYVKAMGEIMDTDTKIGSSILQMPTIFPNAEKQEPLFDFRNEYLLKVNRGGLQTVTFTYDTNDEQPLYEIIYEFESADTLLEMSKGFDAPDSPRHPTEKNTWLLNVDQNNVTYLLWIYENKVIIAANLPKTEFEDASMFKLPKDFVEQFHVAQKAAAEKAGEK
jgi:hypothetical protein